MTGSLQEGNPEYDRELDERLALIIYDYIQLDTSVPNNMMHILSAVEAPFLGSKMFGVVRDQHFRDLETNIWRVHSRIDKMQYRENAAELEAEFRAAINELRGFGVIPSNKEERKLLGQILFKDLINKSIASHLVLDATSYPSIDEMFSVLLTNEGLVQNMHIEPQGGQTNFVNRQSSKGESQKKPLKCHYCGKIGHFWRKCRDLPPHPNKVSSSDDD